MPERLRALVPILVCIAAGISACAANSGSEGTTTLGELCISAKVRVSLDVFVDNCTGLIESGRLRNNSARLETAYFNRGAAHRALNNNERAIRDYSEAIKLSPDFAAAFGNRANAYHDAGEDDRAIADYTEALRLK